MKKRICLLLTFLLVLGMLPVAYAAELPFRDVAVNSWYRGAVEYVYTNGLMNGTGADVFAPDTNMSRGMIVTVLHRLEGSPASSAKIPFGDVPSKQYYYNAVVWSYENGIVNGTSANTFSPDANVTREQLVTIFFRYANAKGFDTSKRFELSGYADGGKISSYAVEALRWAVAEGIITGMDATTLAPAGFATRAQFATIIQRFIAWTEAQTEEPEPTETTPQPTETEPAETESQPTETEPAETEPQPTETEPAETEPQPTETEPVETEPQPTETEPAETEPQPTETEPAETEPKPTETEPEPTETEPEPIAPAAVLTAEKDAELQGDLQADIDNIMNTETEIVHSDTFIPGKTYTGTAYYVSNDGDDNNDGLTPETAWQSMGKLLGVLGGWDNEVTLQPGDAVFLRRGDIFRLTDWSLTVPVDQITFSAYGEGDKPILTCSSENGTGAEKWELVHSDDSGKKIWKYYRDMKDVSMMVLNDGEALTKRVYEFYDGTQYLSCEATGWWMHEDEGVTLLGGLLPLEESMTEDLSIISRPERTSAENNYSECGFGPLYLRCDSGNPGELYSSIEFSEYIITGIVWLEASDTVLDNISFRCNGNSFVKANTRSNQEDHIHWSEYENTVIQNCEFAYGGGCVTSYHISPSGKITVEAQGDGIYTVVKNTTIRNNYFHDMMSSTSTFEWCEDDTYSDGYYHVLDNVMVNTNGIRLDSGAITLQYLDSIIIRGNQVWNNGKLDNGKIVYAEASLALLGDHYGECIVENNVFYGTEIGHENNALFYIDRYTQIEGLRDPACTDPIIRNNIYVQYSGRKLAYFPMWQDYSLEQGGTNLYMEDPYLRTRMEEVTGDTTSEFYVIEACDD